MPSDKAQNRIRAEFTVEGWDKTLLPLSDEEVEYIEGRYPVESRPLFLEMIRLRRRMAKIETVLKEFHPLLAEKLSRE